MNRTIILRTCKHSFDSLDFEPTLGSEHFKNHERIELDEENKEREFQGLPPLSPEEARALHDDERKGTPESSTDETGRPVKSGPKFIRPKKEKDTKAGYLSVVKEAREKPEWGQGAEGYRPPGTPADKLRKNAPYKVNAVSRTMLLIADEPRTVQVPS